jgi:protein-S-isoprenylcysteine O-methyltransferase Ste14
MFSLLLRNLFFTILQPGIVAGLIPYWYVKDKFLQAFEKKFQVLQYLGILILLLGLIIMFDCILRFAVEGKGTLSPADPTKKLVIKGLYRFSRNPMYVGVMLILTGEAIFFQSTNLWFYALFIFIAFNLFIILVEEPRLRKDFGEEYSEYCQKTRRWL